MIISSIVAVGHHNVIGHDNQIPWYLPADLKYFKAITTGHHVIMGKNCYLSIGKPLPNRTNVIITRDPFFISTGCVVVHSIKEALQIAFENGEEEAFIIGGGQIYDQTSELWDKIYLTEVDVKAKGNVFFPTVDPNEWLIVSEKRCHADEKNEYNYTFKILERI